MIKHLRFWTLHLVIYFGGEHTSTPVFFCFLRNYTLNTPFLASYTLELWIVYWHILVKYKKKAFLYVCILHRDQQCWWATYYRFYDRGCGPVEMWTRPLGQTLDMPWTEWCLCVCWCFEMLSFRGFTCKQTLCVLFSCTGISFLSSEPYVGHYAHNNLEHFSSASPHIFIYFSSKGTHALP